MTSTDADSDAAITVTVAPHWVNGWLLRAGATAVVQVDGEDHVARWGKPLRLTVLPGHHEIRAFFRYRGTKAALGAVQRDVNIAAGDAWRFVAKHGPTNGSGLRFTRVARA
ncbi:hypothetical protein GCM10011492_05290 [Flexivirga endophytica]|uniref:Uncharacterized protein n=1 Tax=Flexivirga endophytica TaxID=1849103 RepID=A0A916SVV2_9MICO|nr:hypothetical protein [Flexivirga endophytica]GGB18383.1 hypothetical protein GCM10011492_05290 [Flexivirga endophytica]GHB37270.1 hypothetical protein GCM10008112_02320 [Flexivirga endophytica]